MNINDVHRSIHKHTKRLRIGRGIGSGRGKTSGRGHKGQGQLAGWAAPVIFEGARMPLIRRIPKRGFHNQWGLRIGIVNLDELQSAFKSGDEVTLETLKAAGLCKRPCDALKVLGQGEIKKKLKVTAHKFSASALEKIKAAGGEAVVLPGPKPVKRKKPRKTAVAK
ncbi:MAG TPA: 50S ribosomal protein L15 [Pirellulales bacterium]|jgi:large subunit ribosomal protein L15|nr:50S ribosomal protein L15 [Pirellulales bacterium]